MNIGYIDHMLFLVVLLHGFKFKATVGDSTAFAS